MIALENQIRQAYGRMQKKHDPQTHERALEILQHELSDKIKDLNFFISGNTIMCTKTYHPEFLKREQHVYILRITPNIETRKVSVKILSDMHHNLDLRLQPLSERLSFEIEKRIREAKSEYDKHIELAKLSQKIFKSLSPQERELLNETYFLSIFSEMRRKGYKSISKALSPHLDFNFEQETL